MNLKKRDNLSNKWFALKFQDKDMSISRVEAYLRSAEFVERPSGVKLLIYMRLPHPAVHEKHGQYQVRKNTDYSNKDL